MSEPIALELANTLVSDRPGRDLLSTPDELGAWLDAQARRRQAPGNDDRLVRVAHPLPRVDHELLEGVRLLRAAIRGLFQAVVVGSPPGDADLAAINMAAAGAPAVVQVTAGDRSLRVTSTRSAIPSDALAAVLAESAIEILGGEERARLRACAGNQCRLFFVAHHPARALVRLARVREPSPCRPPPGGFVVEVDRIADGQPAGLNRRAVHAEAGLAAASDGLQDRGVALIRRRIDVDHHAALVALVVAHPNAARNCER